MTMLRRMAGHIARPRLWPRLAFCLLPLSAIYGCASDSGFTKEQIETTLNAELMTGAGAEEIQAFFQRHDFAYTFDMDLRRYKSTVPAGANRHFDIYIYTDNDRKLTVAQVLSTETPPKRPVTSLPGYIYEGSRPGNRF